MDFYEYSRLWDKVINELEANKKNIKCDSPPKYIEICGERFSTDRFENLDFRNLELLNRDTIDNLIYDLNNRSSLRTQVVNDLTKHKELMKTGNAPEQMKIANLLFQIDENNIQNIEIDELIIRIERFRKISRNQNEINQRYDEINEQTRMNRIYDGYYNQYDD